MTRAEQQPYYSSAEPDYPSLLPPDLGEFLRSQTFACVTMATDKGTVYVVKAPNREIQSVRGSVPIHLRHELYDHPEAPVIRTVITICDLPETPLALETFINVENESQRADFAALANQEVLYMLFYDEALNYCLSKGVPNNAKQHISKILYEADRLYRAVPKERFDFDRAKADVMRQTRL